ncbi:hypothetical protein PG990_014502 [Apiospora arundinis]|uniref:Uncharacterized protein n=1 Tax=Apiospora arundinis TaxID=335852 RepID=A0ABR2I9A5_9PEZI
MKISSLLIVLPVYAAAAPTLSCKTSFIDIPVDDPIEISNRTCTPLLNCTAVGAQPVIRDDISDPLAREVTAPICRNACKCV